MELGEYARKLYPVRDDLLRRIPGEAEREGLPAIHIPDEVGRLLQILILASGARRILELGTLFGYSSIWMARSIPEDGRIVTLESAQKHADVSRRNLEAAGAAHKVEVRVGPALDLLPAFDGQTFDLIFIDADKTNYVGYLDWALRLSRPGTLIVADNTWRHGEVTIGADDSAHAMAEFNRRVAAEARLVSTIIPTRDGGDALTVAVYRR